MKQPNNKSTRKNPVGRFMVAIGALIEHIPSGKILIVKRSDKLDWRPGEWEITYGRIAQFESAEEGLIREVKEETGIDNLQIGCVIRVWHIYRGNKSAENDLIGVTYVCKTQSQKVKISDEHTKYRWVSPAQALDLIEIKDMKQDVELFIKQSHSK